jgi:hypothetical protein
MAFQKGVPIVWTRPHWIRYATNLTDRFQSKPGCHRTSLPGLNRMVDSGSADVSAAGGLIRCNAASQRGRRRSREGEDPWRCRGRPLFQKYSGSFPAFHLMLQPMLGA